MTLFISEGGSSGAPIYTNLSMVAMAPAFFTRNLKICSEAAPGPVAPMVPNCVNALSRACKGLWRVSPSLSTIALRRTTLKVMARLCAWIAIAGAPSAHARTSPSEVEAQKLEERPITALRQTEPLGDGVILTRPPSASKYLSCSATQIAQKAKLGTAVIKLTSGNSFCCALTGVVVTHENMTTVKATISILRLTIAESPFLSMPGFECAPFGFASATLSFRSSRQSYL